MASGSDLLRMLEPAVRPVSTPESGGGGKPRHVPIEQQSFEALLAEAQGMGGDAPEAGPEAERKSAGPLGPLARVDAIENVSLRAMIARSSAE